MQLRHSGSPSPVPKSISLTKADPKRKYARKLREKVGEGAHPTLSLGVKSLGILSLRTPGHKHSFTFHRDLQNMDFSHAETGESDLINNPHPFLSLHKGKQNRWLGDHTPHHPRAPQAPPANMRESSLADPQVWSTQARSEGVGGSANALVNPTEAPGFGREFRINSIGCTPAPQSRTPSLSVPKSQPGVAAPAGWGLERSSWGRGRRAGLGGPPPGKSAK